MENQADIEYELSKRNNVRKFNHKVPNINHNLNEIFETKESMNNSTPEIISVESILSTGLKKSEVKEDEVRSNY